MRAALYLRISQDRTGDLAGVTRQQEDCQALADDLGWQIAEIYIDNDISASTGAPRPAYRRMLADIESERIDGIICWHPDRLYRRLLDLEELIPLIDDKRIIIRTCRAGDLDLSTSTGKMLARILGAVSQGEVERMSERWKRSYRQRREAGEWMGSGPRTFGYERDGSICEPEAAIVRRVAVDILEGASVNAICRQLNDQGITTTRDNPWGPTALRGLLTNPRLAGLVTTKGEIGDRGAWDPLLDRHTWEALRNMADGRRGGKGPSTRRSLLGDLTACGYPLDRDRLCGVHLIRSFTSIPVYQCRTAVFSRRHVTVSARALEEMVEGYARERLSDERVLAAVRARLAPGIPAVLLAEIEDYEAQLAELRDSLAITNRDTTRADIVRAIDAVRDEIDNRRSRIRPNAAIPIWTSGEEWPDDLGDRGRLIRLVVARIWVDPVTSRGRFDPSRVRIDPN